MFPYKAITLCSFFFFLHWCWWKSEKSNICLSTLPPFIRVFFWFFSSSQPIIQEILSIKGYWIGKKSLTFFTHLCEMWEPWQQLSLGRPHIVNMVVSLHTCLSMFRYRDSSNSLSLVWKRCIALTCESYQLFFHIQIATWDIIN